jgi:PAS domain S-box-containing protein
MPPIPDNESGRPFMYPAVGPFDPLDGLSREELRQRLQSLQALLAQAPVPIAIAHDPDCQFISANRALAVLLGVPDESNVSLTPPDTGQRPLYRIQRNGKDLPRGELPMQFAIAERTFVSNEIEIVRADGTVVYVQNDVQPLFDTHGEIYGCVSVCVDLTERRRAESVLRDADRRKDEFLATLSHELRNPLAPIRTALEVMRIAGGDVEVVEKARATMERQVLHLVRITDDLLDVSRITQNKVELRRERIDLRSVLHSAADAVRPLMDAKGQSLILELPRQPLWMDADSTRLSQVFSNLLNNANKYTDRGGLIRVTAVAEGQTAAIAVADSGAGIPSDMLTRIFEMFTQVQEFRDRRQGGLGIGLTLAKRLAELHGGSIEARSDGPGRGSTFTVRMPLAAPVTDRPPTDEDSVASPREECRVLVAEDNPDAAEMMRVMLSMLGHDVRVATDGVQAVALAEQFDPHIGFLDIGMPLMDGYEAARQIRNLLGRRIVLVALTGWGQDEDKRRSRDAGFDHHLTKPPEPEVLSKLIAECAEGSRTQ